MKVFLCVTPFQISNFSKKRTYWAHDMNDYVVFHLPTEVDVTANQ